MPEADSNLKIGSFPVEENISIAIIIDDLNSVCMQHILRVRFPKMDLVVQVVEVINVMQNSNKKGELEQL